MQVAVLTMAGVPAPHPLHGRSGSRARVGLALACSVPTPPSVRRTPGISCERPIRSALVCFIPLFDGADALTHRRPPSHSPTYLHECVQRRARELGASRRGVPPPWREWPRVGGCFEYAHDPEHQLRRKPPP
jgi:hypothetical protein